MVNRIVVNHFIRTMYDIFEDMTFDEIVDFTIEKYINEKGRGSLNKLFKKVMTSNKLSGLLSSSKFQAVAPSATDVMACINEIGYFIFSSNFTQVCAGVLFFKRWDEEVNQSLFLLTPEQLRLRAISCYATYKI